VQAVIGWNTSTTALRVRHTNGHADILLFSRIDSGYCGRHVVVKGRQEPRIQVGGRILQVGQGHVLWSPFVIGRLDQGLEVVGPTAVGLAGRQLVPNRGFESSLHAGGNLTKDRYWLKDQTVQKKDRYALENNILYIVRIYI
jgi:hypothetical protein